jgi:hypothetical protein
VCRPCSLAHALELGFTFLNFSPTHHWLFVESRDGGLLEKQDFFFFFFAKTLFFNLKHLENIINTLMNLFMVLNNIKKAKNSKISSNLKIFLLRGLLHQGKE